MRINIWKMFIQLLRSFVEKQMEREHSNELEYVCRTHNESGVMGIQGLLVSSGSFLSGENANTCKMFFLFIYFILLCVYV